MDIKSTFLHGDLKEEIYMEQPLNMSRMTPSLFVSLRNLFMVLSKAPLSWYAKMDSFLLDIEFSRCHFDPNVYTEKVGIHIIIFVLYVDDLILTGNDPKFLTHVKSNLKKEFEMIDLGYLHYFLVLQILETKEGIFLS
jgi:hypothetical protein